MRALLAVFLPAVLSAQVPQVRHEIVRGRITGDSAKPLAKATIIVTRVSDRQFKPAESDASGQFETHWPDGTGEYVVNANAPGYAPLSKHITRNGADSVLVADLQLVRAGGVQSLSTVVVTAQQAPRARDAASRADVGATDFNTLAQNAARRLSPDQAGDLSAIAAMGTGVMPVNGGISVLGLGASQNSVTLNGLAFNAADIPRDAITRVRVTSSSYDPSIGWFSGARTQVDLWPGTLFTSRNTHGTLDVPAAQWTDPVSARLGQQFTNINGSIGGTGQLVNDLWSYNYGLQGGRKTSDFASLTSADANLLQHSGVARDSVIRLTQLLQTAGIPLTTNGAPLSRVDDNVSFIGRIDHAPYDWKTLQDAKTTWGVTGFAKWSRTQGQGLGPTSTVAHAGETSQGIGSLQGEWSSYFGRDYLADIRSSASFTRNANSPYVSLPDGRVLVASSFAGGSGGVSNLSFGGNSGLRNTTRNWTWESIGDVQLYSPGLVKHKVRVSGDVRFDAVSQDIGANALGSYTYNSLADLEANRPSSFMRTLNSPTRNGAAWNAFAAIGDVWRASPNLQVTYGARGEGNVFASPPAYNPAVQSAFGVRTDHAPNTLGLSPRLGFLYNIPGPNGRPSGSLHGGVGEFRNLIDASLLAGPSVTTGLPNGTGQLSCFGDAVPVPNWSQFDTNSNSIPQQCANGAGASFTDAAPVVRLMSPTFTAPQSWRANLGWSSTVLKMPLQIEGTISENLHQRGSRELNFSGVQRFATSDEARPVFANAASIVPASGIVSPVDARKSSAFGSVNEGVSDLRSESRQLAFTVRPFLGHIISPYVGDFIVGYTLASIRDEQRGFDQATFGDPSQHDWTRGALDARHQFVVQGALRPHPGWNLIIAGHLQSGTPYTPMVRSDVNGDGLANDRAFVFDPAHTSDPALAAGMQSLLAHTSSSARDCLLKQMGSAAGRSSCEGPWSATLTANLRISGQQVLHIPRMDVTLGLANPLGGLDQMLHGSNNLRGWGTRPAPDPVLMDVRGFDAANNRFLYSVNPRFGSTSAANNAIRAPFRLTLDVALDIAPSQTEQQMDRWLGAGKSAATTPAQLTPRLQRTVPDPYAEVMRQADSLLLTVQQLSALRTADDRYRQRVDSLWSSVSNFILAQPNAKASTAAYRLVDKSTDDAWEITRLSVQRDFRSILTPDQLTLLPALPKQLYTAANAVHIRMMFSR